jgi:hypothetical protein
MMRCAWLLLLLSACAGSLEQARDVAAARLQAATGIRPDFSRLDWEVGPMACGRVKPAIGCWTASTNEIRISTAIADDFPRMVQTLVHEGGHSLRNAPGHLPNFKGVMGYGEHVSTPCLTPADLDFICEFTDCVRQRAECHVAP